MSLFPTIENLKFLSDAIDAKEERIDAASTPDRRLQLSKQLQWLQRRFRAEYTQFLVASEQQGDLTEGTTRRDAGQEG